MTDLSSSSSTSTLSLEESGSSLLTREEADKQLVIPKSNIVITTKWEKFEGDNEKAPLIQWEDKEKDSWEDLLEASVNLDSCVTQNKLVWPYNSDVYCYGYRCEYDDYIWRGDHGDQGDKGEGKLQNYSHPNPFLSTL